jgi:hypothetical protein
MGTAGRGKGKAIAFLKAHVNYAGDDCLVWPMSRDDKGYGRLKHFGEVYKAHRLMCELAHGKPPTPLHMAAHSCGNGPLGCVHPHHVSWKTAAENTADAIRHGKYGHGVGWKGKLSKASVSEIRALGGRLTNLELGLIYKVHPETIAKIRRGETWRKVA